jgi:putative DNA primase/helicase
MTTDMQRAQRLTDVGNAERLVDRFGDQLRFCGRFKSWYHFDGWRWIPDEMGIVVELAKEAARGIYREASEADPDQKKLLAKHAVTSERDARIRAMISLAESEPGIPVQPQEFDRDPFAFNVLNGTIDLRTGRIRPHDQADLITKLSPIAYDREAPCERWERFLLEIMNGDVERVAWLQRAIGYSLTASTAEQCLFIPYGQGANGKTITEEVMRSIAGDYAAKADFSTFLRHSGESPRHDLARLLGARLVTASEVNEGKRLDEAVVKEITGSGTIAARRLYAEAIEFRPTFKIWLSTNHKPVIGETGHGIWRRIRLIPFDVTIPEEHQDRNLLDKLRGEAAGVLAWAVAGAVLWHRDGLGTTSAIAAATADYREDMDTLGRFIRECCETGPELSVAAGQLYAVYDRWATRSGEHSMTMTAFGRKLSERGFEVRKSGNDNTKRRFGLQLTADAMRDSSGPFITSPSFTSHVRKVEKPSELSGICPARPSELFDEDRQ